MSDEQRIRVQRGAVEVEVSGFGPAKTLELFEKLEKKYLK